MTVREPADTPSTRRLQPAGGISEPARSRSKDRWSHPTLRLCLLLALTTIPVTAGAELVLNEMMADNDTYLADEFGEFDDWLEIHNTGATPINIEGKFLTDDLSLPMMFELPDTVIGPGQYLIVWCDNSPEQGPLHTNFRLNDEGESIGLFDTLFDGNDLIDSLTFDRQADDISLGRFPNATGPWEYMADPTPGAENSEPTNIPPILVDTGHTPLHPLHDDVVTVTTRVIEDFGLAETTLHYDAGLEFIEVAMADDGNHGDGAAGDGVFGAEIPVHPPSTRINYYVAALDDSGAVATDPNGAPGETYGYVVNYEPPPLFVNEFLASNVATNSDEFGEFDDWVEIYNGGDDPILMGGKFLTDDLTLPTKYEFPELAIPAGGFLLIWCDGDPEQGLFHADFKLGAGGEQVGLFDIAALSFPPIDTLEFGLQTEDVSFGRVSDGAPTWTFFPTPTPGATNDPSSSIDPPGSDPANFSVRLVENPVRLPATFLLQLDAPRQVVAEVFDVRGRRVSRAEHRQLSAGLHRLNWDGRNDAGGSVAPGVYFYRVAVGEFVSHGKLSLLAR